MLLEFTRGHEVFFTERETITSADILGNITFQQVSFVVDTVFLALNAMGIRGLVRETAMMKATLRDILKAMQNSPQILRAFQAFFTACKEADSCKMRGAYALLCLCWECSTLEILWTFIKSRYEEMSTMDWCKVSLSLGTLFFPPPLALGVRTWLFAHDLRAFPDNIKKMSK